MCFTETWFKQDSIAEITGFNLFFACQNEDKIGGGVLIDRPSDKVKLPELY